MILFPDIDSIDPGAPAEPDATLGFRLEDPPPANRRRAEPVLGRTLFDDDFDLPPPAESPEEPEIIEPVFSLAELDAARAEGYRAGQDAERQSRAAADRAAEQRLLGAIAAELNAAREAAEQVTEDAAEALARLLLDTFAAVFPAMCARFAETEMAGLVQTILPVLRQEPRATIRLPAAQGQAVMDTINQVDPDLSARVDLQADPAMADGDIRVTWRGGEARRDMRALWAAIGDALDQSGWPLPQAGTPIAEPEDGTTTRRAPNTGATPRGTMMKETANVE